MLKPLRDIRSMRILVLHPKDRERDELAAQLRRIGCRVEAIWPPEHELPGDIRVAFVLFRQDELTNALLKLLAERAGLTIIGIIEFESPAMIEAAARAGTAAVITKPIRAFGLLSSIVIACNQSEKIQADQARIAKLEGRLKSLKLVEQAKSVLMAHRQISEEAAYSLIRSHAMQKRLTMEAVCTSIIEASEIFQV